MPFLDREHFTPHFFSEKRKGSVTSAVTTLLGTLLGKRSIRAPVRQQMLLFIFRPQLQLYMLLNAFIEQAHVRQEHRCRLCIRVAAFLSMRGERGTTNIRIPTSCCLCFPPKVASGASLVPGFSRRSAGGRQPLPCRCSNSEDRQQIDLARTRSHAPDILRPLPPMTDDH